jgi:aconitase A
MVAPIQRLNIDLAAGMLAELDRGSRGIKCQPAGARSAVSGDRRTVRRGVDRIDTPQGALYYANGGILQYVLRQLLATKPQPVIV